MGLALAGECYRILLAFGKGEQARLHHAADGNQDEDAGPNIVRIKENGKTN
jgi:hypothetical protein